MESSTSQASSSGSYETELGDIDIETIQRQQQQQSTRRKKVYVKYTPSDRYKIGKYASENGPIASVRKFKLNFPSLNESTARTFRGKYEEQIAGPKKKGQSPEKVIAVKTLGRPLLLGGIDSLVQKYILGESNRGAVISRGVAVSTAKALMIRNPNIVGNVNLESSYWAQSLFRRMGFVRRRATTAKLEIPAGALKEAKLLYLNDIVSKVDKFKIPDSLIINIDQTPTKYVRVGRSTIAKKCSKTVAVSGSSDKRTITATFAITVSGEFLPMQLIYGGKTSKSLPRFKFPDSFSLSVNPTHYSNEIESCKLAEEILLPYITKVIKQEHLPTNQKALVIMDVFTGQMTPKVLNLYKECNIEIVCVPANMTHLLQPLDLTVNGFAKKYTRGKFGEWYSAEIGIQLDAGKPLHDITVPLKLSQLKPLHAQWMVDLLNEMTKETGRKNIASAWKAAGINEALALGMNGLESLDRFQDIDAMMEDTRLSNFQARLETISQHTSDQLKLAYTPMEEDQSESESEWEEENECDFSRNAFDDFNDEPGL